MRAFASDHRFRFAKTCSLFDVSSPLCCSLSNCDSRDRVASTGPGQGIVRVVHMFVATHFPHLCVVCVVCVYAVCVLCDVRVTMSKKKRF